MSNKIKRYALICVCERDIDIELFDSFLEAQKVMMDELMDNVVNHGFTREEYYDLRKYQGCDDWGFNDVTAWSNTSGNVDWRIVDLVGWRNHNGSNAS